MNSKITNPKKILVIKNDHIGDMIFYSGIFRELKKKYPNAKITAVVSRSNKPIIERNKNVDDIIVMPHGKKFLRNFNKYPSVLSKIRKERFDIGIDIRGDFLNTFFLLYLGNVKYKIGFYDGLFTRFLSGYFESKDINNHETMNMLKILNNGLGINAENNWPDIAVDSNDIKEAEDFIKQNKLRKFICIVPDSGTPSRQWPLEEFDKVIKYIKENYPCYKIVLSGVDEEKMGWLMERNPGMIKLGKVNIRMIYPFLKKSSLTISLDTGTAHIAWAGRTNLITILMKASIPEKKNTAPLNKNSRIVLESEEKIKAEKVIEAVDFFLRKK